VRIVGHKCDKIKLLQEGSLGKYSSIPLKALLVSYWRALCK